MLAHEAPIREDFEGLVEDEMHTMEQSHAATYVHFFEKRDGQWKTVGSTGRLQK